MANFLISYTGDGATTDYTVQDDYIRRDHIRVELNGVVTTDYSFLTDTTIRFDTAPALDVAIDITRDPPNDVPLNTFGGTKISDVALNENFLQGLQVIERPIQEAAEAIAIAEGIDAEVQAALDAAQQAELIAQDALDQIEDAVAATVADGSITTAKLANDAVTNAKLADNAVNTENVVDESITIAKLDPTIDLGAPTFADNTDAENGTVTDEVMSPAVTRHMLDTRPPGIPIRFANGAGYTVTAADNGYCIELGTSFTGTVSLPGGLPAGFSVSIYNGDTADRLINVSTGTLNWAGEAEAGARTIAPTGLATCIRLNATDAWVISGAGLS